MASNGGISPEAQAALDNLQAAADALAEIARLVKYEWRVKDYSAGIVLNSIEQVLDDMPPWEFKKENAGV